MAVLLSLGGTGLERTTGLVPASGDQSFIFSVYIPSLPAPAEINVLFYYGDDPQAFYSDYVWLSQRDTSSTFQLAFEVSVGAVATTNFITNPGLGWHIFWYTRTGTSHKLYIDGVLASTITYDISGITATNLYLLTDTYDNGTFLSKSQYFREWDSAVSTSDLLLESNSSTALSSVWCDTPLVSDLLDDSGNNRDWTNYGTGQSFVAGPLPIALTNISALTAYNIASLPASFIQIVGNGTITQDTWFQYTPISGDIVLGANGFGGTGTFQPHIEPYTGPASSPTSINSIVSVNRPLQFPVTIGTLILVEVNNTQGNITPALVLFTLQTSSNSAVSTGDIFINDDTDGFPAAIIDVATSEVKKFISPFPAGEAGDILSSGINLVSDETNNVLKLYDSSFNLLATPSFTWVGVPRIRTSNEGNKFYVGSTGSGGTPAFATTVLDDGSMGPDTWTFASAGLKALAANTTETILYYSQTNVVQRWDIVNDVALSDLVAALTNYQVIDILVLTDNTLIVSYFRGSNSDTIIKHFNSGGTLLNTYSLGSSFQSTSPRMAYAIDNPNSFWIWTHPSSPAGTSEILNIKVSDGSILDTVSLIEFESGVYQGDVTVIPTNNFGPSFSCPLFIIRSSIGTTGTITVNKVGIPTTLASLFNLTAGGGLTPSSFQLASGDSQTFIDVPAGTGYSISEDPIAGFLITLEVSNGSDASNITVGADEDVIVTVTNELEANELSGIYKIIPNSFKSNDTLWISFEDPFVTEDVEIPRPFARTGLLGE